MPQGAAFGSQSNRTGSWSGGNTGGGTGMRGPLDMSGQFAAHTNANGPAGYSSGQTNPGNTGGGSGGVGSTYQGAVADYAHNYLSDPLSRVAKFFTGVGLQQPNINKPATYANSLSHTSFNPAQVAGTVLGGVFGVPGVGSVAGGLYDAFGGPHPVIGNAKPGIPGSEVHDFSGSQPTGPGPSGNTGGGNPMFSFGGNPTPGGASFGQQPTIPTMPRPPVSPGLPPTAQPPGMFIPQLPNHSLPQDYTSMFPNSLSPQDQALLYGKALSGGVPGITRGMP